MSSPRDSILKTPEPLDPRLDRLQSETTRAPSANPRLGGRLEGPGCLPRGLVTSGKDRERDLPSPRGRSPTKSRSTNPRHVHPERQTCSGSGANDAGSRSRRSNSPPSVALLREHSPRRRAVSTSLERDPLRVEHVQDRHHDPEDRGSSRSDVPTPSNPVPSPETTPAPPVPSVGVAAEPGDDPEPDGQTFVFGDYKFMDVMALLRKRCDLPTFFQKDTSPSGSTVFEALTKGRPTLVPTLELPWLKMAASARSSLEKQLEEDESSSSGPTRSASDRFTDPITSKLKWYPVRDEISRALPINGKFLDLVDKAKQDQLQKPHFSYSSSEVEKLETTFGGMSRASNFLDATLLALSSCLKGANLPKDTEGEAFKLILAASRANETINLQAETSRANIILRRRDAALAHVVSLPQEDRLRLRSAPLGGQLLFPDHLISTARENTRSVVRDEAFRRAVIEPRTRPVYVPRPGPSSSSSYYPASFRGKKKKKNKGRGKRPSSSLDPPLSGANQQQLQQPLSQPSKQPFRGKGKGRGSRGRK